MKNIFGNWWVVTGLVVLLLVLVLCVGVSYFFRQISPWQIRILLFSVIVGIWGLVGFLRVRKSRRAAAAIAAELTVPSTADAEGKAVAARMAEALATLKTNSSGRRDYLYNRPWYVIIGPPGAGTAAPRRSLVARSRTTTNSQPCELPGLDARVAPHTSLRSSSSGTGSGFR